MKKNLIKISENDLHNIIKESVNNILQNETPPMKNCVNKLNVILGEFEKILIKETNHDLYNDLQNFYNAYDNLLDKYEKITNNQLF